jgi:hypothetical protein
MGPQQIRCRYDGQNSKVPSVWDGASARRTSGDQHRLLTKEYFDAEGSFEKTADGHGVAIT